MIKGQKFHATNPYIFVQSRSIQKDDIQERWKRSPALQNLSKDVLKKLQEYQEEADELEKEVKVSIDIAFLKPCFLLICTNQTKKHLLFSTKISSASKIFIPYHGFIGSHTFLKKVYIIITRRSRN